MHAPEFYLLPFARLPLAFLHCLHTHDQNKQTNTLTYTLTLAGSMELGKEVCLVSLLNAQVAAAEDELHDKDSHLLQVLNVILNPKRNLNPKFVRPKPYSQMAEVKHICMHISNI